MAARFSPVVVRRVGGDSPSDLIFPRVAAGLAVKALRGPGGFQPVMEGGSAARHGPFRVHMLRGDGHPDVHLGVGVAKKRVRHATARNRLKRHVRESARAHAARLRGLDLVVFVVDASAAELPPPELRAVLARLWEKGLTVLERNPRQSPGRSP